MVLKRPASVSPDNERASKRPATSSPEEGELDDTSPPPVVDKPLENLKPPEKEKQAPPISNLVRKRDVERRSRKEETELYGHGFTGCGSQSDYEVTRKLGEGTFGEVHKALHKTTRNVVALKRILMHNEKDGMPVTALREIKILKALKHPCVVEILDMFVVRSTDNCPLSVYMVFPYMDHDLAGLLENEKVNFQPSQIKLYMKQLLQGTDYMHRNHIVHRDMKAANLLISNTGSLRIADFGLARSFNLSIGCGIPERGCERKYTNCVVTRWYRPPELLLGARQYGGEVDIWGIGCVLGEMFHRRPILQGTSDLDQLEKIWHLCGTPNQHSWPNFDALPGCEGVKRFPTSSRRVKPTFDHVGVETCDLIDKLLVCNPKDRPTAAQALDHDYFWTDPLPADPRFLPSYEASHELDKRGHRKPPPAVPPLRHAPPPHRPPPPEKRPPPPLNQHQQPSRPPRLAPPVPGPHHPPPRPFHNPGSTYRPNTHHYPRDYLNPPGPSHRQRVPHPHHSLPRGDPSGLSPYSTHGYRADHRRGYALPRPTHLPPRSHEPAPRRGR